MHLLQASSPQYWLLPEPHIPLLLQWPGRQILDRAAFWIWVLRALASLTWDLMTSSQVVRSNSGYSSEKSVSLNDLWWACACKIDRDCDVYKVAVTIADRKLETVLHVLFIFRSNFGGRQALWVSTIRR